MTAILPLALTLALAPGDGQPERERATTWHQAAAAIGITGAVVHFGGLVALAGQPERPVFGVSVLMLGNVLPIVSVITMGTGGYWVGRADAIVDRKPRRREAALGWSLIGVGFAGFIATRIAPAHCYTSACVYLTSELGYFGGLGMMAAGAHLAGHARGYRHGLEKLRVQPEIDWTDTSWTVGVSGRF